MKALELIESIKGNINDVYAECDQKYTIFFIRNVYCDEDNGKRDNLLL